LPAVASCFAAAYLLLLGWGVAFGLYYTWDWPIYWDGAIIRYIAWRILQGNAPYRDVFEGDFPGTFLLHMTSLTLQGRSDFAFRMFDLFFCMLSSGLIVLLGWRACRFYAISGGLFYIVFHLSWGAESMAERDFLMVPFLLFSAWMLRISLERPNQRGVLFLFGVSTGYAFWIKPLALLFAVMAGSVLLLRPAPWKRKILALVQMGLGIAVPALLIHGWLWHTGGLAAFYDILINFTLPIYPTIAKFAPVYGRYILLLSIYSFFCQLLTMKKNSMIPSAEKTILIIGLLFGYANFYFQGKGSWYHLYPLAAFTILYFTMVTPRIKWSWPVSLLYIAILAACIKFSPLMALSAHNLDKYKENFSYSALQDAAHDADAAIQAVPKKIRETYLHDHPHEAVQFFTPASYLWNVAYRQEWVTPSRHLYPLPIYGEYHYAYMDALADEIVHDLSTKKPLVIFITSDSWPFEGPLLYEIIDTREPWKTLFAKNYRLNKENPTYRVYARIK